MAEDKSAEVRQHTVIDLCQDFGNNTSMHGLRNVVNSSSPWKRGIWSLIVMGGFGWAIFQLQDIIKDYYRYPVTSVVQLKHDAKMRFPAVTICNLNSVDKSMVPEEVMPILEDFLTKISDENIRIFKHGAGRMLGKGTMSAVAHRLSDMTVSCKFDEKSCSANDFVEFQDVEHGLCYTFNPKNESLMYTTKPGWRNGLILELDIYHRNYLPWSRKAGAKVIVHDHDEVPFPEEEGFLAGPGLATSIALSQTVLQRLPSPYGTCISQDDPATRQFSMFPREQYRYTENACRKSCYQALLISKCGCCDPALPCENSTFLEISRTAHSEYQTPRFCTNSEDELQCILRTEVEFYDGSFDCTENCPFACDTTIFNTVISTALWPSEPQLKIFLNKLNKSISENKTFESRDELTQFVQNNFLRLEIYYQTLDMQEIITKPVYDWSMVLGDIGGQLGLWLGFSLLTAIEIVEFIVDAVSVFLRKLYGKGRL